MGDELRVELDAIERELWLYVRHFVDRDHAAQMSMRAQVSDDPAVVEREIGKLRAKLTRLAKYTEGIEDWYADSLAKLRSHGRAADWPDEPWSTKS